MIPAPFKYHRASDIQEAISLFNKLNGEAKYMSGGHSLLPMMKLRFVSPEHLIDIGHIKSLSYIKEENGHLRIGAMTTESELEHSKLVQEKYPILFDGCKMIADPSVRNFATVGGNIAHGDAANDHPAIMLSLGAKVTAEGSQGVRTIPISEFFLGVFETALQEDEILTELSIPLARPGQGNAYLKMERKVGDYAIAGVAVNIVLDSSGSCIEAGIGLTNVTPVPMKVDEAESILVGGPITEDSIKKAAAAASAACEPNTDLRGSDEFKRSLVKELVIRGLKKSLERAKH